MIKILENLQTVDEDEVKEIDSSKEVTGVILDTREFNLDNYQELRVISRVGVGMDNIDFEECKKRNIKVYNTPCDELTQSVAEFTIKQILTFLRRHKRNLKNLKIGIIGYGRIGQRIEFLLSNWTNHKFYINDIRWKNKKGFSKKSSVLKQSDIVIITVSGNDQIINKEDLKLMKSDSILVNMARRECVNEDDVLEALYFNRLFGFISDVNKEYFDDVMEMGLYDEFINKVLLSSHIASNTYPARKAMEEMAVRNLMKGLED